MSATRIKRLHNLSSGAPLNSATSLRDLLPRSSGRLEDIDQKLRLQLPCCTLCGGDPFFRGTYWVTGEEHAKWKTDFLGYCLCLDCFRQLEMMWPRLVARFRYFLDGPEGRLPS